MSETRSMIWVDTTGKTRMTLANVFGATVGPIQTQLELLSNAIVSKFWEGTLQFGPGAPGVGNFQNVQDYAELVYQAAADGTLARLTLPAPASTIFLADQETVNPAAIAALNAVVIGDLLTGTGQLVTSYIGGIRRRKTIDY